MADAGLRLVEEDGEARRLADIALRYREPLFRYFLRRGLSVEVAEDCVQDVFVRLGRASGSVVSNAEAYLFTIAGSVVLDHHRWARARREGRHDPLDAHSLPFQDAGPAQTFEDRETLARLAAALRELPPRTCEIFLLNRLDRLSYTQLAARYGVSVKAIEKQMSRALAHIRKRAPRDV